MNLPSVISKQLPATVDSVCSVDSGFWQTDISQLTSVTRASKLLIHTILLSVIRKLTMSPFEI